jgi:CBS domain-containing protein
MVFASCDADLAEFDRPLPAKGGGPMKIEQLMTKSPMSCEPGHTLSRAAELMWTHGCRCLPVTAGDGSQQLVGLITDRDICMAAHLEGKNLSEIRVGDAMTNEVWACNPGDPLQEAEAIMREARVRFLPVVDGADQLLGLLSLADLAREAVRQHGAKSPEITATEVAVVLAMLNQEAQR